MMSTENWNDPQIIAKRARLKDRAIKCAHDLAELMAIDRAPSILRSEADLLSDIVQQLTERVDAGQIRLTSALRIMELVFDLQDEGTAERKRQLTRHARQ